MILFWALIASMLALAMSFVLIPLFVETPIFLVNRKIALLILGCGLPLLAITGYLQWGDSQGLKLALNSREQVATVQKLRVQLQTPSQVIKALQERLKQDPNSAQGWFLLGRIYVSLGAFKEAVRAFAQAEKLDSNNPDILFQYAQALYFYQHSLKGKPAELLNKLLQIKPQNDLAINLLAIAAYEEGNYQQAIDYWEKILPNYTTDSSDGQALLTAIAKAQTALAAKHN